MQKNKLKLLSYNIHKGFSLTQSFTLEQMREGIRSTSADLVFLQEFLLGVPPNSSKKYEQNQMGITFNHAFGKHIESELGYRYIYRKRRLTDETDNENALVAGLLLRF